MTLKERVRDSIGGGFPERAFFCYSQHAASFADCLDWKRQRFSWSAEVIQTVVFMLTTANIDLRTNVIFFIDSCNETELYLTIPLVERYSRLARAVFLGELSCCEAFLDFNSVSTLGIGTEMIAGMSSIRTVVRSPSSVGARRLEPGFLTSASHDSCHL